MARINFDDDVESKRQFWELLKLCGGNRYEALGRLVCFFRLAQRWYGRELPIPAEELAAEDMQCMVESGWALPVEGGFQSLGADKYFAWYLQKREAGKKGGRPPKPETDPGNRPVSPANRPVPPVNLPVRPENPLALAPVLAPAPAPAPAQKPTPTTTGAGNAELKAQVSECWSAWTETLEHFGIQAPGMNALQQTSIARAITQIGFENALDAIRGVRLEGSEEFDPRRGLSLDRVLHRNPKTGQQNWDRLGNLWRAKNPNKTRTTKEDEMDWSARFNEVSRQWMGAEITREEYEDRIAECMKHLGAAQ